ncbi:hypothetical protein [Porcipelethomonas sp.]|uniref:hypothetical protein n=1 Tax=Porcipelethomonas sp. TaxID=2981675 RepID=UPI003EF989D7
MSIAGINSISDLNSINSVSQAVKTSAAEEKSDEKVKREDTYVKSSADEEKDKTGIYSRESLLEQLRNSEEQRIQAFQETIRSMMAKQGQTVNLTFRGMDLHITEEQRLEAEKSISDGGEYSVDSVSGRILDMAKALAGDDSSKISLLKDAVIKGFNGASEMFGKDLDSMPEITRKTYDEVMKRFDEWENSFKKDDSETENDQTCTDIKSDNEQVA